MPEFVSTITYGPLYKPRDFMYGVHAQWQGPFYPELVIDALQSTYDEKHHPRALLDHVAQNVDYFDLEGVVECPGTNDGYQWERGYLFSAKEKALQLLLPKKDSEGMSERCTCVFFASPIGNGEGYSFSHALVSEFGEDLKVWASR